MSKLPFVQLKAKRNSVHPWIYHKMVARPSKKMKAGELVEIKSKEGEFIGHGFYNRNSNINIRVINEDPNEIMNEKFFHKKIQQAVTLRKNILQLEKTTDSYRVINSEGDYLSGLIVDKFGQYLVIEPLSAGYIQIIDWVINSLMSFYPTCQIIIRGDEKVAEKEGISFETLEKKFNGPETIQIQENSLKMKINLATGHKTGFFLDQRDNRHLVSSFAKGKTVLDLCCYTGGFAISCALNQAKSVTAIDLDEKAIDVAHKNAHLNQVTIQFKHANTFDVLRDTIEQNIKYDLIILDPPKLAKNKEEISKAFRSYYDLNKMAMQCLNPQGILVTFSCTGNLSEPDFLNILTRASNEVNVNCQFFQIQGPGLDHPFSHQFPEGRYLKAVYSRIAPTNRTYQSINTKSTSKNE